jgi:hypothetical protein
MQTSKGRFIYRAALFRVSYYRDLFKERLKMEKIRQLSRIFPDIVKSCHNFYCDSPFLTITARRLPGDSAAGQSVPPKVPGS